MKQGELLYENSLSSAADLANWRMEGEGMLSFPAGRMRMESRESEDNRHHVINWCDIDFPDNILISWDFYPLREPGLANLFFAARGHLGEDIFDYSLATRSGQFKDYEYGDMHTMHLSYFRRNYPANEPLNLCNLYKSYGHHLVASAADPIPESSNARGPYQMRLFKAGPRIRFSINNIDILEWLDDGDEHGPALEGGKIGFRQMAPLIAEYGNFRVYSLK